MSSLLTIFSGTSAVAWYILLGVSFFGGLLASISPCSLAMLPLIIGYIGGFSKDKPQKIFLQLCIFILGTAIVFSCFGMICALTGKVFASVFGAYFMIILASLFLVLGLKLLNILDFEIPMIIKSMPTNSTNSIFIYPLLLGMTFALAGTPCSTPILAGIMGFAALGKNLWLALAMLFLFALGQGLILIIAGIFTSTIKNSTALSKFSAVFIKISGLLLIGVSLYMYYKVFSPLF